MRRLCLWLIYAYPPEFRAQYGSEVLRSFDDGLREETGSRRLWFILVATLDIVMTAAQERYQVLVRNLTQSYRRFLANPMIALAAVLSLAIGIGANSTIFSIIYASLLRPIPYPDAGRIVMVHSITGSQTRWIAPGDFFDFRDRSRTLQDWHLFTWPRTMVIVGPDLPERLEVQQMTRGLLESLGVRPVIGRFFRQDDPGGKYVLLGEHYWRTAYGGSTDVLGKTLLFEGGAHTILGVVPGDFELFSYEPGTTEIYGTITPVGDGWKQRRDPWMLVTARLKPGVTKEQAQAELSVIADQLAKDYPVTNRGRGVQLMTFRESHDGDLRGTFWVAFAAVGFLLLIACANVANLLLALASARRRELSVRAALGASRRRLMGELLSDGLLLALPGVAAGVLLAIGGIHLYLLFGPAAGFPVAYVELNRPVLLFAAAAGLAAGILSALFPAINVSRIELTEAIKEGGRGSGGRQRQRMRSVLVAGQIALSMILLVAAGLTINTALRLQNFPLAFDPDNITIASLHMTGSRYISMAPMREIDMRYIHPPALQLIEHTLRQVRALPGVEAAAIAADVPMGPGSSKLCQVKIPRDPGTGAAMTRFIPVTDGYFEALRIPLRRGRYLAESDTATAVWTTVVNEAFVRAFFPHQEALGSEVLLDAGVDERPRRIVGIVADVTRGNPRLPVPPEVFASYSQLPREVPGSFQYARLRPHLIVRSASRREPNAQTLGRIVAAFDNTLAVYGVKSLREYVSQGVNYRFTATLWGICSALSVLLALVGIYGVMHYAARDREHEIGIRMALGASFGRILGMMLLGGLKLTAAGLVIGTAGALWTARLFRAGLFGIEPWDPATFAVTGGLLLLMAMTACLYPAIRAARIDCIKALRNE